VSIAIETGLKSLIRKQILAIETPVDSPEVARALETIKERLLKNTEKFPYDVEIMVLESNTVNAFALPGGLIVVNSALILQLDSTEEMAAVLAHELGHVMRRDSVNQLIRQIGLSTLLSFAGGQQAEVLVQRILQVLLQMHFSRSVEEKADDYALRLLNRSGIDPACLAEALELLKEKSKGKLDRLLRYIDSHPDIDTRIQLAREFSKKLNGHFVRLDIDWKKLQEKLTD